MGVEGVGSGPSTPSGITANDQLDDWTIALGGCLFRSKPRLVSIMIIMSMMLQVDRVGEHEETRHDSWDFVVIRNWRRHPSIKENQRRRLTPWTHLPEPHHHQGRPVNLTCHPSTSSSIGSTNRVYTTSPILPYNYQTTIDLMGDQPAHSYQRNRSPPAGSSLSSPIPSPVSAKCL